MKLADRITPDVWARAGEWLFAKWLDRSSDGTDEDAALLMATGIALCTRTGDAGRAKLAQLGEQFDREFAPRWGEGQMPNPLLLTQAHIAFAGTGHLNTALRKATLHVATELKQAPAAMWQHSSMILLAALLGTFSRDAIWNMARPLLAGPEQLLFLSPPEIRRQLELWTALTSGSRPFAPSVARTAEDAAQMLPAVMLSACKNYQLDLAASALRLMIRLGLDPVDVREGLDFLLFQQRGDGNFGYLNPLAAGHGCLTEEERLAIHLPLTVEILWTLHEAERAGLS